MRTRSYAIRMRSSQRRIRHGARAKNDVLRSTADTRRATFGALLTGVRGALPVLHRQFGERGEVDRWLMSSRRVVRWATAILVVVVLLDNAWTPSDASSSKARSRIDPALLAQAKADPTSS